MHCGSVERDEASLKKLSSSCLLRRFHGLGSRGAGERIDHKEQREKTKAQLLFYQRLSAASVPQSSAAKLTIRDAQTSLILQLTDAKMSA